MYHILVIEEEPSLREKIRSRLQDKNHRVLLAEHYKQAERMLFSSEGIRANVTAIDLIILDVDMSDQMGWTLLEQIQNETKAMVILLLSKESDKAQAMQLRRKEDRILAKPFRMRTLLAKVDEMERVCEFEECSAIELCLKPFCFSFEQKRYYKHGAELNLSRTEEVLLKTLVLNRGKAVSKEELLRAIWTEHGEIVEGKALAVAVKRLRQKIESNPSVPEYIKNVYGIGYMWNI